MKVRILPSSPGDGSLQYLVSFLVDGRLAIDAGCLGLVGTPRDQAAVRSVFLTHSHADHVCSLPIFVMNVLDCTGRGVTVHAPAEVLQSLRRDLFNGRVWPDFTTMQRDGQPVLRLEPVLPGRPTAVDGLTVTATPVNHPVPTVAYLVDDGRSAVLVAIDTAPTKDVWAVGSRNPRLKAAFIDVAFPDDMADLAARSGHLTPDLVRAEVGQLPDGVAKIAVHLKPAFHARIVEQLRGSGLPNLSVGEIARDYQF